VLRLALTTQDLTRIRFAFSPLWEVVASVRVLKTPADNPLHLPWVTQTRTRLTETRLDWGCSPRWYRSRPGPSPGSSALHRPPRCPTSIWN
jgi:hypothetical protein